MKQKIRDILGLPISTPIDYFCRYWEDYASKLNNDDEYMVTLDSPRIVLDGIITELKYNGSQNKENIKYFLTRLGIWRKKDISMMSICGDKVILLLKNLEKYNTPIIQELSIQIITDLDNHQYTDSLIKNTVELLEDSETSLSYKSKQRINICASLLIAELSYKGYGFEDIKSIMHEIPDIFFTIGHKIVSSPESYYEIRREDYNSQEKYHEQLIKRIEARTVSERFDNLREKFSIDEKDAIVIVRMKGIQGEEDFIMGDVTFYSPKHKLFITEEPSISNIETLPDDEEQKIINAAIPVKYKSFSEARLKASYKLDQVIDILTLAYKPRIPFSYSKDTMAVIENGNFVTGLLGEPDGHQVQDRIDKYLSKQTSDLLTDIPHFNKLLVLLNDKNDILLRMGNSIHWFEKACSSSRPEEKLLFCWFALESMLNVADNIKDSIFENKKECHNTCAVIRQIASELLSIRYFHEAWHHNFLSVYYATKDYDNYYDFTIETISKTGLNINNNEKIPRGKFLSNLDLLIREANDELLKNKLERLKILYTDSSTIKDYLKAVEEDILMIYRLRNLIVHNAVISSFAVQYYSKKAIYITQVVLNMLLNKNLQTKGGLDKTILQSHIDFQLFIGNIDNEIKKYHQ